MLLGRGERCDKIGVELGVLTLHVRVQGGRGRRAAQHFLFRRNWCKLLLILELLYLDGLHHGLLDELLRIGMSASARVV